MKKIVCCFILLFPFSCFAASTVSTDLTPKAKSAILIEANSGEILYEKNSHERRSPASMTKMMSMLLILEHIESGALSFDDMITVSKNASSMGGSQILLEEGEQMSVRDLFKGVAIGSGNDAVVALAEAVSGSVDSFKDKMNEKVKELGLKDTLFQNPHGLDSENHYSTAYDMAMIAKELVKHKEVLEFTSIYEDYLRKGTKKEFWLVNTNRLVKFNPIVDGLKTGYTKNSGYCLTATAKKQDMRLIATVMGEETITDRSNEVTQLLDFGYANYKVDVLLKENTILKEEKKELAKNKIVLIPKEEVSVLNKKTDKLGKVDIKLNIDKILIPSEKGSEVGSVDIYLDNQKIKTTKVITKDKIEKVSYIHLFLTYLKQVMTGNIF